jgi:hypothetical protein
MTRVPLSSEEISCANRLSVTVGTNCPQGGDSGHGGRTVFRLQDLGATDLRVRVDSGDLHSASSVEIVLRGDSECETFIRALEYALSVLRAQHQCNRFGSKEEDIP